MFRLSLVFALTLLPLQALAASIALPTFSLDMDQSLSYYDGHAKIVFTGPDSLWVVGKRGATDTPCHVVEVKDAANFVFSCEGHKFDFQRVNRTSFYFDGDGFVGFDF